MVTVMMMWVVDFWSNSCACIPSTVKRVGKTAKPVHQQRQARASQEQQLTGSSPHARWAAVRWPARQPTTTRWTCRDRSPCSLPANTIAIGRNRRTDIYRWDEARVCTDDGNTDTHKNGRNTRAYKERRFGKGGWNNGYVDMFWWRSAKTQAHWHLYRTVQYETVEHKTMKNNNHLSFDVRCAPTHH